MKTMNKKYGGIAALALVAAVAAAPLAASADPSVTINSVVQRWPWNNKVDITYTVTGGQTRSAGVYCGLRFAVSVDGVTTNFVEGYTIGASAENGQHTVTWTAPEGIVSDACTMTATLFTTNVPSGNDYMIVDLNTGAVWYEGLASSQAESNARYNTDLYKGTNTAGECFMVLRKVPKWADKDTLPNAAALPLSGYPTGGWPSNTSANWMTDRDYYVGVFPVTQQQYQKVYGSNPSGNITVIAGNEVSHRPVENASWRQLRNNDNETSFPATSPIPAVSAPNTGSFFQRLNYRTGLYFDLPTVLMFEIAQRAGATTAYSWGDEMNEDYVVCAENSGGSTVAVGSRLPNNWGLYDTSGNVLEWSLNDNAWFTNYAAATDPFAHGVGVSEMRTTQGHDSYDGASSSVAFKAAIKGARHSSFNYGNFVGFRVSLIAE